MARSDTQTIPVRGFSTFSVLSNDTTPGGTVLQPSSLRLIMPAGSIDLAVGNGGACPQLTSGSTPLQCYQVTGQGTYYNNGNGTVSFQAWSGAKSLDAATNSMVYYPTFVGAARGVAYTVENTLAQMVGSTYAPNVPTTCTLSHYQDTSIDVVLQVDPVTYATNDTVVGLLESFDMITAQQTVLYDGNIDLDNTTTGIQTSVANIDQGWTLQFTPGAMTQNLVLTVTDASKFNNYIQTANFLNEFVSTCHRRLIDGSNCVGVDVQIGIVGHVTP